MIRPSPQPTSTVRYRGPRKSDTCDTPLISRHPCSHTDLTLNERGFANGWWSPREPAIGMPYQWGGFDTLASSSSIATAKWPETSRPENADLVTKEQAGKHAESIVPDSSRAAGGSPNPTHQRAALNLQTTQNLDSIATGDILLNDKHVLLFKGWDGTERVLAYEAGLFRFGGKFRQHSGQQAPSRGLPSLALSAFVTDALPASLGRHHRPLLLDDLHKDLPPLESCDHLRCYHNRQAEACIRFHLTRTLQIQFIASRRSR